MPNMIEEEALYRKSLGVTSDIVLKEMYYVNATGSEKSEKSKLVLRPEGTAGVLRSVLNDPTLMKQIQRTPVKTWYWGPMFRHERPQTGRLRQFYQIGVEHIGGANTHSSQGRSDTGYVIQSDFEAI